MILPFDGTTTESLVIPKEGEIEVLRATKTTIIKKKKPNSFVRGNIDDITKAPVQDSVRFNT